jgi:acetylornithine deacetylase
VARLDTGLSLSIREQGFRAPGCLFDLDGAGVQALARAYEAVHGGAVERQAITATTDARHFKLMLDTPVTCFGPEARNIHGIDESVSIDSMLRVTSTFAQFLVDWCGVEAFEQSYRS